MARLKDEEIVKILKEKGFVCNDLTQYVNKASILDIICKKGHKTKACIKDVQNTNFRCAACDTSGISKTNIIPEKKGHRIVGIDNATENVGISVFDNGKLVYYTKKTYSGSMWEKIIKNQDFLENIIIKEWKPDFIIVEDIQYQKNILTYKILAILLGVTIFTIKKYNIQYETVISKVWRAHFMLNGGGRVNEKLGAIKKVKSMYDISVVDDIAEAILLGKFANDMLIRKNVQSLF